jgi:hypothetical protein
MFECPESDIVAVRVDKDMVDGDKPVEYIRRTRPVRDENVDQEDKAKTYA